MRIFGKTTHFSRGKRLFALFDRIHRDFESQTAITSEISDQLAGIRVELTTLNSTLLALLREEHGINPQTELPDDLMGIDPPDAEYPNPAEEAFHQTMMATDPEYKADFLRRRQREIDPDSPPAEMSYTRGRF